MKKIYFLLILFSAVHAAHARQVNSARPDWFDTAAKNYPVEKIFLHLDKPYYALGDTLWFKAYLFTAGFEGSPLSGVMYLELANEENKVVKRMAVPVVGGLSWGEISLDTTFKESHYTLRAYTNWMLNFGNRYVYTEQIRILHNLAKPWLGTIALQAQDGEADMHLRLTDTHLQPLSGMPVQLTLMQGQKKLHAATLNTDTAGMLDFYFHAPGDQDKDKKRSIRVNDPTDPVPKMVIPMILNRPQDIDLQFMPEGGNWILDEPVRMAFKAIGEDGKGVDVAGDIINGRGEVVGGFRSSHLGMGSCMLFGQAGETYQARITQPEGDTHLYTLPPVLKSGTSLQVHNTSPADSLLIQLAATPDIIRSHPTFYLTGRADGQLLFRTAIKVPGQGIGLKVSKSVFPPGVVRFALLDAGGQPLNERLVYVPGHDPLNVEIRSSKQKYAPRDSVALMIRVTNESGSPVRGSFSMSVTDDAQVKTDPANDENINSCLYLSSFLKGYVESPGYYFNRDTFPEEALDNLLLTQGWVAFDRPDEMPAYRPEPAFEVRGKVLNTFNKPLGGVPVLLLSSKPPFTKDTVTGEDGSFVFTHFPPLDSASFFLETFNRKNKSMNVGIELDEFKAPALPPGDFPAALPWNVNTDTTMLRYASDYAAHRQALDKLNFPGRRLKEVVVTGQKIIKGSYNMNGPGGADEVMDETEIMSYGRVSLFDMIMKRFKHLLVNYYLIKTKMIVKYPGFYLDNIPVSFLIDGDNISQANSFDLLLTMLRSADAQDFKGIEVMSSMQYINKYNMVYSSSKPAAERVYIEITSRSGKYLFQQRTPGTYTYRPIPFSWPRKFYSPRYTVKGKPSPLKDLRSTLYWDPDIETDSAGKAVVHFYTADNPSSYTVIIQGSDMNGHLGFHSEKIVNQ